MEGPRIAQNRMLYELMNQDNADLACNDKLKISQKIANMTDKDKQADLIAQLITFKYHRKNSVYSDSQQNACWEHIENKHLLSGDNNEKLLSKEELMFFVKNRNHGLFSGKIPETFKNLISNFNDQEKITILLKIYKDHPETAENIMHYLGNVTGQNWSFNLHTEKQSRISELTTQFFSEIKRINEDRSLSEQKLKNLKGWRKFITKSEDGARLKENIMSYCLDNNVSIKSFADTLMKMCYDSHYYGIIKNGDDVPMKVNASYAFDIFKEVYLNPDADISKIRPSKDTSTLLDFYNNSEAAQERNSQI
ncbi:MAG: hypothetical protein K0R08_577 [Solimicrobium sp.]|jgi:hypothetical protein|nr:hypothetical protein [Solimicrobium sp.]